ncbi:hypothetical protein BDP67DRAFT_524998 [Colletotrichum lupini]|nr:hypothetical protein BDP67DRAFT_524998 [Colletotrichum lupini]
MSISYINNQRSAVLQSQMFSSSWLLALWFSQVLSPSHGTRVDCRQQTSILANLTQDTTQTLTNSLTMRIDTLLAILGTTALAAADAPAVTPFLTQPGSQPTTLVPQPSSSSAIPAVPLPPASSAASPLSSSPPSPPSSNSSSSAGAATLSTTTTSRPGRTRTISLAPVKTNIYQECGGLRPTPNPCPASFECIDDPFRKGCGLACDQTGICVVPIMCGGIAAIKCPAGKWCVDDPRDDCHPLQGGADCAGLCV